jgi:hypothetical protein
MTSTSQLEILLSMFAVQVPVMIVCLAGCLAISVTWSRAPSSSFWALLGFGIALILCFAIPVAQWLVQNWVVQGRGIAYRASLFAGLSILWSLLRALSYGFLLLAVFAGRSTSVSPTPPPVSQL